MRKKLNESTIPVIGSTKPGTDTGDSTVGSVARTSSAATKKIIVEMGILITEKNH